MSTDIYYGIGKSHEVCEDHALRGVTKDGKEFVIISDGCSSSENTDIGAGILANCAAKRLKELPSIDYMNYYDFGRSVIHLACDVAALMQMNVGCLDATLLLAVDAGEFVYAASYGDGCILTVTWDRSIRATKIEYRNNKPFYLSYLYHGDRLRAYQNENDDEFSKVLQVMRVKPDVSVTKTNVPYDDPSTWCFSKEVFEFVIIGSDGITSFKNSNPHNWGPSENEVLENVVAFKNCKGRFLSRRIRRMISDYAKENIFNYDDVSLGVIKVEE